MALIEEFKRQGDFLFHYRGFLPIPLFILGLGIHIYNQYQGIVITDQYYAVSFIVGLAGLLVRVLVIGYAPLNTSGRNTHSQVADLLNTKGMYSIVRHPLYLGNFLMWFGVALLTQNIWFIIFFILFFWLYYERIMFAEEAFLRNKFGVTYLNWAENVPPFIPNIKNWQSPIEYFSYKNALRREYTGLFKLIVVFYIFQYAQSVIRNNSFSHIGDYEKIWLGILGFGIIFYFTIRFLHKKTRVLKVEDR
jgi:protein-S-isoprenylcysteine O-methyltransferase Ste14